jgi:hypothetical protein
LPPAQIGDFNENGKVDAADYVLWRKNVDGTTELPNDNDLGTPIGAAHYNLWRSQFGLPNGSGSGSPTATSVPEPATGIMVMCSVVFMTLVRRRSEVIGNSNTDS